MHTKPKTPIFLKFVCEIVIIHVVDSAITQYSNQLLQTSTDEHEQKGV